MIHARPNRYAASCSGCKVHIPAEEGFLTGKDESDGHWIFQCLDCFYPEELATRLRRERAQAKAKAEEPGPRYDWRQHDGDPFAKAAAEAERPRREAEKHHRDHQAYADRLKARSTACPPCFLVLGLVPPVEPDQVKKRFRELVFQVHPDRGGSGPMFVRVRKAYEEAMALVGGQAR